MKKEKIYKLFYVIAALLLVGFVVSFGVDAYRYCRGIYQGSAPLYVYAIVDAGKYLLPSLVSWGVGVICRKKYAKKDI